MIVRIGIIDGIRDLRIELDDTATIDEVRRMFAADSGAVWWLRDGHGNDHAVRVTSVAWVEVDRTG